MTRPALNPGKIRRLQSAASPAGVFRILAVDHRKVLLKMMDPTGRCHVPAERVTQLKLDVVRALAPLATAVILDPQYSIEQAIERVAVPDNVGMLASLPGEAFRENTSETAASETWGVARARQVGACGVKLFVPYHPAAGDQTASQDRLVRDAIAACAAEEMPLYLEPVLRPTDPNASADSLEFAKQRRGLAIMMAQALGKMRPDILKLEFPVDSRHENDESAWRSACAELNDASPVPWALLSRGESFDVFKTQLQIACEAGCSGFMAGRTVWEEAAHADASERETILRDLAAPRIEALNQIAERYGKNWRR